MRRTKNYLQGLEHLMFNLGIGNIEFTPTHTLDEHRPSGFKVPDIEEIDTDLSLIETETIVTHNGNAKDERLRNVAVDNQNSETDDILWTNDNSFKTLHDPKHRHPRHHGELYIYTG